VRARLLDLALGEQDVLLHCNSQHLSQLRPDRTALREESPRTHRVIFHHRQLLAESWPGGGVEETGECGGHELDEDTPGDVSSWPANLSIRAAPLVMRRVDSEFELTFASL
jgi:hypothetical protein